MPGPGERRAWVGSRSVIEEFRVKQTRTEARHRQGKYSNNVLVRGTWHPAHLSDARARPQRADARLCSTRCSPRDLRREAARSQRVSIIRLPTQGGKPKTWPQSTCLTTCWTAHGLLFLVQLTLPIRRALPCGHYFLIILGKLLSTGEFGLDGPDTLFLYFIFVCYDFQETLGIHRKLGISALNIFFLLFWHTRQEIGLSFQHCFQKSDFYGWEFSLKMITFGSRSRRVTGEKEVLEALRFFSSTCRKPVCKTNIMEKMGKKKFF